MARVDFYLLAEAGEPSREHFACRLAEKAYGLQNSVHIQTANREQAAQLDELLWTFRDGSFLPHEQIDTGDAAVESPVTIGSALRAADLLINLTDRLPAEPGAFPRIAEIVTSDEDRKQHSRKLYAEYRAQGHSLELHEMR
jgi:DNA polymerase III subunit chi